jgi:single-stranded-DNA-specific exonuclease
MTLEDESGKLHECIQFGADENTAPEQGRKISVLYYPDINEFNGRRTIQFVVSEWK